MQDHELHGHIRNYSQRISEDYEAINRRVKEDPGTAGDQGEVSWQRLLEDWLPEGYTVVTKGRILGADGTASPQIDLIVLKPNYPKFLKKEKYYLFNGVAAAFECKINLKLSHFEKIFSTSKKIADLQKARGKSISSEVLAPLIYGVLAHTSDLKGSSEDNIKRIEEKLIQVAKSTSAHPRELPELFCIADLASWRIAHCIYSRLLIQNKTPEERNFIAQIHKQNIAPYPCISDWDYGDHRELVFERPHSSFTTLYAPKLKLDGTDNPYAKFYTPLGSFIASLYDKMAYRSDDLFDITDYFKSVHIPYSSGGVSSFTTDLVWNRGIVSDKNWFIQKQNADHKDWKDIYF
ncbi:DUF6602 domain-containing protein [Comamonas testosteroni]|uniref:DUF6602 domain-containing protein n=1 Tax=Comamonas testosteroni TaxID=285 RepID=UPI000A8D389C|nr:DUF6602 domain-containing protein [Comamonas testosteroni]